MKEQIRIMTQVIIWQEYYVDVPEGMTKEEYVKELIENDPSANHCENDGIDFLFDTEEVLKVEYYDEDKLINSYRSAFSFFNVAD